MTGARNARLPLFLVVCGLAAGFVALVYAPGLSGPFLFDDHPNLGILETLAALDTFSAEWWRLVLGNHSGPTGRPLAMLSFAAQASSWPHSPFAFKLVNLLLHLATGALIALLCVGLLRAMQLAPGREKVVGALVALAWALHPIHVSALLHSVQRMTVLSSLCMVAALALLLRCTMTSAPGFRHLLGLWLLFPLLLLAAVLSKESGILLCALAGLLLIALPARPAAAAALKLRLWSAVMLAGPLLLLGLYLALSSSAIADAYALRDYTLGERLLTQPAVLLGYAADIVIPTAGAGDFFHDDTPVRQLRLAGADWLPAVAVLAILAAALISLLRRPNLIAFGLLWFFLGHALESTVLPLELRFQHRNYLPSLGLLLALAGLLLHLRTRLQMALLALFIAGAGIGTAVAAAAWGNAVSLSRFLLEDHLTSPRAWEFATVTLYNAGQFAQSAKANATARQLDPTASTYQLQALAIACAQGPLSAAEVARRGEQLREARLMKGTGESLRHLRTEVAESCESLTPAVLGEIGEALMPALEASADTRAKQHAYLELGLAAIGRRDLDAAMEHLERAYQQRKEPGISLLQAQLLESADLAQEATYYRSRTGAALPAANNAIERLLRALSAR